jgi:hypothetical protein
MIVFYRLIFQSLLTFVFSPNPSLPRNNTNQVIPINNQSSILNNYRRTVESSTSDISKSEPLPSIDTMPTNNRREQPSTIASSSSAWRVFGIPQLYN